MFWLKAKKQRLDANDRSAKINPLPNRRLLVIFPQPEIHEVIRKVGKNEVIGPISGQGVARS